MKRSAVNTVAAACYAAAGVVERGWIQGSYFMFENDDVKRPTCACALGAIRIACGTADRNWTDDLSMAAELFVRNQLLGGNSLTDFNDQEDMTKDDIVALLTTAGDLAVCEMV